MVEGIQGGISMSIKYKVVYKGSRLSIAARGEYRVVYNKGTTVKSPPNTLGIMVFKMRRQAEIFRTLHLIPSYYMILRVKTFRRGVVPKKIGLLITETALDLFYKNSKDMSSMKPPRGTICYDEVEVID